jgi:hypothetical protein
MARRQFRDANGALWNVWDVIPDEALPLPTYDRRGTDRPAGTNGVAHRPLDPALERGWLCFQHEEERRRFVPVPPHWEEVPDGVLRVMLEIATPVLATPFVQDRAPTRSNE